jgi:pyruvate dehydrogenase E2 component (dihydrolipoamide acetyltransferase)
MTAFRKVAIGTWRTVGDPSVYSTLELETAAAHAYLEKLNQQSSLKITLTHLLGKCVAETIRRHPEMNSLLRFGKLYSRKHVDIFFQVASDTQGNDLSGSTVRKAEDKTVFDFAQIMQKQVSEIRTKGDPAYRKMKNTMKMIPGWLAGFMINLSGFIMYTLNIWTPLLGTPRDPFGSIMITNIGSLGLDSAFVPLVPYSRVPCLIAMGAVKDLPIVKNGKIEIASILKLAVTIDHRVIDGMHASHLAKTLRKVFENPEQELGGVTHQTQASNM